MHGVPTETALYRAVLEQPAADEPRLQIADFYDARNDPRGRFIRLQLAAARSDSDADRRRARVDANALLDQHRALWSSDIPSYITASTFVRGFVEMIALDATRFLADATVLYAIVPIRFVVLTDAKPVIDELAESEHMARIVKLTLSRCGLSDADLARLVRSPHLRQLKALEIGHNEIGMPGLEALCATPNLPQLEYVHFAGNTVESPVESFGEHWETGAINPYSIEVPEHARELEARYGPKRWVHGPSKLRNYPPSYDDL